MKITALAVKHPISTSLAFIALGISGLWSIGRLGLELFPNITMPAVAIVTAYPGAGTFEVEAGVTKPVEDALAELGGVESVSSTSSESVSFVTANFAWGTDMDTAIADMRERLNTVSNRMPEGSERPMIYKYNPETLPFMTLSMRAGDEGVDLRRLAEKEIVPLLEKTRGVATVGVYGGKRTALIVKLDLDSLSSFQIAIPQILQVFKYDNVSLPAGSIVIDGRYLTMRTIGDFESPESVGDMLVGYKGGAPIYLRDLADVTLSSLPQDQYVRAGGNRGVYLSIRKQLGYNTVMVAKAVRARLAEAETTLPPSLHIDIQTDQSVSVEAAVRGVTDAAWQGGLLAILVLVVFLRSFRPTLIMATLIPLSVVSIFGPMLLFGYTLNITSLMGISLSVGLFVDNFIVVLETIYRKRLSGMDMRDAAIEGASEVGGAVLGSTLTNISIFIPMLFVQGFAGQIINDLAFTISFSNAVALIASITLLPMLSARFLKLPAGLALDERHANDPYYELSLADVDVKTKNKVANAISSGIKGVLVRLDDGYERLIEWSLGHVAIVLGSAGFLLALSFASVLLLGMEFVPETDEGRFSIAAETVAGAPFERTEEIIASLEAIIRDRTGASLVAMTSQVGRGGGMTGIADSASNIGVIDVTLKAKDARKDSVWKIINDVEAQARREIMDARFVSQVDSISALANTAQGGGTPVEINLSGEDFAVMVPYAQRVLEVAESVPGTRSVQISYKEGKPELQFRVKRREASSLGITPFEAGVALRTAFYGTEVSRYSNEGEDYPIFVMLRDSDRSDPRKITRLFFVNQAGTKIPIENVAEIEEGSGPFAIQRRDRSRIVNVTAYLDGTRPLSAVNDDIAAGISSLGAPPPGVRQKTEGTGEVMNSAFGDLFVALMIAVALVYIVMASQFESLTQPLIIMFSIPFAATGMIGMLLATGTTFNMLAFIGAILLVGYVVNNGIVLVDYMNALRERGLPLRDSIIKGGRTRLKPIMMSIMTSIFSLVPLALGIGTGAELQAPMGRAVLGGLVTSTLVTLVLIPTLYWLAERKGEAAKLEVEAARAETEAAARAKLAAATIKEISDEA